MYKRQVLEKDVSKHLCAYYVCDKPANLNILKNYLRRSLPSYMAVSYTHLHVCPSNTEIWRNILLKISANVSSALINNIHTQITLG